MKRRLAHTITCIVIAVMMLSVMTLFPHAEESDVAQTAQPARDAATSSLPTIEEQIRAYAKSIDQPQADSKASSALASHGLNGRGKTLSVGEEHALTAALMNSEVVQRTLIAVCTKSGEVMQTLGDTDLYLDLHTGWAAFSCYYEIYRAPNKGPGDVVWNSPWIKGIPGNAYDNSLVWIAGSIAADMEIKQTAITEESVTYQAKVRFWDCFDFSASNGDGFKDLISGMGALLFHEFDWEATVEFQIVVSNTCTHTPDQYHYSYDPILKELTSDATNGYTYNSASQMLQPDQTDRYYYQIDRSVCLNHDRPWTLQYTVQNPNKFCFSQREIKEAIAPYILNYHREFLLLAVRELTPTGDSTAKYYGTALSQYFSYNAEDVYTFTLQNRINSDGSNMIYVTVCDQTQQTTVMQEIPMDDCYTIVNGSWVRGDTDSNGLSGIDLVINYVGNHSYRFAPDHFDLKIWENGKDGSGDWFTSRTVAPTCAEQGYTLHTCACCGYSYKDNYTPALAHTFGTDKITAPTCTAQGYTSHTCIGCGYTYKDSYTPALGHKFGTGTQTVAPTCTAPGKELYTCSVCAATETRETPSAGHRYFVSVTLPTCTEQGYTIHACFCGDVYTDEYVPAKGHVMGDWTPIQKPTCTEDGFGSRECIYCHATETGVIPTTAHTASGAVKENQVLPTCSADGQYDAVVYCKDCHTELSRTVEILEKIGHSYPSTWTLAVSPTCTQSGSETRTCRRCGNVQSRELEAIGHSYLTATVTPPTCTQNGYTTHTCHCGASYTDNPTRATGHDMSAWTPIQAPTCEHAGTEQRICYTCHTQETQSIQPSGHTASEAVTENRTAPTCTEQGTYEFATYCTVCSAELERVSCTINALGHAPATEWTVDAEPDCTNAGSKSHRCTRCDRATDHVEIPATGHDFGDWYQTAAPTCTQEGTRMQHCTRCDYSESEQISATGHAYTQAVTPPTCTEQGYTTHTCHCGEHYTDSYTDALGHTESDWIVDSEPPVNQEGSRHTECTVCHTVLKTEAIEVIPETTEPETDTETESETETELKTETEIETDPAGSIPESTAPEATEPDTETETQPEPEPDTAPNGCKSLLGGNLLFAILLPAILPLGKKRRG